MPLHDSWFCILQGKEFETRLKEKKPGDLSDELRIALGMPTGPVSSSLSLSSSHSVYIPLTLVKEIFKEQKPVSTELLIFEWQIKEGLSAVMYNVPVNHWINTETGFGANTCLGEGGKNG